MAYAIERVRSTYHRPPWRTNSLEWPVRGRPGVCDGCRQVGIQFRRGRRPWLFRPFRIRPQKFGIQHSCNFWRTQAASKQLIKRMIKGGPAPKKGKIKQLAPVIDLMSALKKSIAYRQCSVDPCSEQGNEVAKDGIAPIIACGVYFCWIRRVADVVEIGVELILDNAILRQAVARITH